MQRYEHIPEPVKKGIESSFSSVFLIFVIVVVIVGRMAEEERGKLCCVLNLK
jgi:hypothetical protein